MPKIARIFVVALLWLLVVQCQYPAEQADFEDEDRNGGDEEGYYYENDHQDTSAAGVEEDAREDEEDRATYRQTETTAHVHEPTQPPQESVEEKAPPTTEGLKEQKCEYDGQILPVISPEGEMVCYKFRVCKKDGDALQDIRVTCPFGLEWKQGTYECQAQDEKCRVQRLDDPVPTWLNYLLSCPSTASLPFAEQSEVHRYQYFKMLNDSVQKQNDRHTDFLTPLILELGIFRHAADDCASYFRCNYQEKSPFVHVLNSAIYQRCDNGKMFNQDWNRCLKRDQLAPYGNYRHTHPDPNQRAICEGS